MKGFTRMSIAIAFATLFMLTSCSPSTTTQKPKTDSTSVTSDSTKCDSTNCTSMDSVKTK